MPQQDVTGVKVFLGAYVQRASASFGLNNTPTSLDIDLIEGHPYHPEDSSNAATGFLRTLSQPGNITGFKYGALEFAGIIQSWRSRNGPQGYSYNVRLVDPRVVFSNIIVGLDSEILVPSGTSLGNVFNLLDFYDNPTDAHITPEGVTFKKIRDYLDNSGVINIYGKDFTLVFSSGFLDQDNTTNPSGIPTWYRIAGTEMSLDSLLQRVGQDMGLDYYVYIDYDTHTNPTGQIVIQHIDRDQSNDPDQIAVFVSGMQDSGVLINWDFGQELRSEATTVILHGAPQTYWVFPQANEIRSYWGRTDDGNVLSLPRDNGSGIVLLNHITGSGSYRINSTITYDKIEYIKTSGVTLYPPRVQRNYFPNVSVSGYYASELVMRAALYSQDSWETILYYEQPNFASGLGITDQRFLTGSQFQNLVTDLLSSGLSPLGLGLSVVSNQIVNRDGVTTALINAVYEATRETAEQYYGRSWFVTIGNSSWAQTGEFNSTNLFPEAEFTPVDYAWSEQRSLPTGSLLNYPSLAVTHNPTFRDEVGRFRSFLGWVDYDTFTNSEFPYPIDLSLLKRDEFFIENQGDKLVVPIKVEQFERDPDWGIVTLNVPLQAQLGPSGYNQEKQFYDFLIALGYTEANILNFGLLYNLGETHDYGLAPPRAYNVPHSNDIYGFFIAMQSTIYNFGPFVASGSENGGIKVVRDSSLGPWTYGNYENFLTAGQQLANLAVVTDILVDSAELTVAGLPDFNIGESIGTAANINGLSIQLGAEGLTTRYSIKTFALPNQRLTKLLFDKVNYMNSEINANRRDIVNLDKFVETTKQELLITKPSQLQNISKGRGIQSDPGQMIDISPPALPTISGTFNPIGFIWV